MNRQPPGQRLLIWAITRKDLIDAIRYRQTLAVMLSALFMVGLYRLMPLLFNDEPLPYLLVYDAGQSALVEALKKSNAFELRTFPTQDEMLRRLAGGDVPELGLVIPQDFDQQAQQGAAPVLQGYAVYWVSDQEVQELAQTTAAELSRLANTPLEISLDGSPVYPGPDAHGLAYMINLSLVYAVVLIGLMMSPSLMFDEKQNHTLDFLLVSPASSSSVVIAKALVGMFYAMLGAGVAFALNYVLILNWPLAVLTAFLGALLAAGLGLILGTLLESRQQFMLWSWVFFLPLFIPLVLEIMTRLLPIWVGQVLTWVPTVAMFDLFIYSMSVDVPAGMIASRLAWLAICATIPFLIEARIIQRIEPDRLRGGAGSLKSQAAEAEIPEPRPKVPQPLAPAAAEPRRSPLPAGLRLVLAILDKDLRDALQNRVTLSIILSVTVMLLIGQALPAWLLSRGEPRAYYYDAGESTLLPEYAQSQAFDLYAAPSAYALAQRVSENSRLTLGLLIPADFDRQVAAGGPLQLDGYAPHWASAAEVEEQLRFFERQLSQASGATIHINVAGRRVYPGVDSSGYPGMAALNTVLAIVIVGMALSPYLLLEEKETHTLQFLLVSPARLGQVVLSKFVTGLLYCLLAAGVALAFNYRMIVHWNLVAGMVILSACSVVLAGLLVGIFAKNMETISLGMGLLIFLSIIPVLAENALRARLPESWMALYAYLPPVALASMVRMAFSNSVPPDTLRTSLLALAGAVVLMAGMVAWKMRKLEG